MRIALLVVLAACGEPIPPVDELPIELDGRCDASDRVGGFRVIAETEMSFVAGEVADGVNPITIGTEIAAVGSCRLVRRDNLFCDPGCGAGEVCGRDNQCVPLPVKRDLGPIRVTGIDGDLVLEARPPGNDYFATDVPHPVFADGAEIRVRGDEIILDGLGSAPLSGATETWVVSPGEPVALTWDPPAADRSTSVWLRLSIDQHGNTPATLTCELDDTGAGEIPAEMVDALLDAGVSGFPNATMTRATFDRAVAGGGCVDLEVGHPRNPAVSVAGHTPCNAPGQCPGGQTCDLESQTCIDS